MRLALLWLAFAIVAESVIIVRHKDNQQKLAAQNDSDDDQDLESEFDEMEEEKERNKKAPSYMSTRFRSKAKAKVTLLVSHGSKETSRGMDEQVNDWFKTDDKDLKLKGWNTWASVEDGFLFKHKDGGKGLQCQPSASSHDLGMALQLNLDCEETTAKPVVRFLQRKKKEQLWGEKTEDHEKILASFWHKSCDGHVPYCNSTVLPDDDSPQQISDSIWGDFDFAFFSVDSTGFYGCDIVSEDYCEMPIHYPFIEKNTDMKTLTKRPDWHELETGKKSKEA